MDNTANRLVCTRIKGQSSGPIHTNGLLDIADTDESFWREGLITRSFFHPLALSNASCPAGQDPMW